MAVKSVSSRVSICSRGGGGGGSAVEESSYIAREKEYSEYYGRNYYPKYSEDLVATDVMLPENAPPEYSNPSVLWNAVEMNERAKNAQLARKVRMELPNEWSYELAEEVVRDLCQRNFVDEGMCAQYAIHDSENEKTGQRNLHVHIMLTMRGIDENGGWMPKQKKVYLTDENGERIPLIDKTTGKQKVDAQNRKQWKCKTIPTNDWGDRDNARKWRKDFVDTFNAVNERLGNTENTWEYRSFKERGLEIHPQIHLGEKSAALERAGIQTVRGNVNREILAENAIILKVTEALEQAKKAANKIVAAPVEVLKSIRNEIVDMIREMARRNNGRLRLPIVRGQFLSKVSHREALQNTEMMEGFLNVNKIDTFEKLKAFKEGILREYKKINGDRTIMQDRIAYLTKLLERYQEYEPFIKYNRELWQLPRGFAHRRYEQTHIAELASYDYYRGTLKSEIREPDKKITPKVWKKELSELQEKYEKTQDPYGKHVYCLAAIEVLEHNKTDLERMLANENKKNNQHLSRETRTVLE